MVPVCLPYSPSYLLLVCDSSLDTVIVSFSVSCFCLFQPPHPGYLFLSSLHIPLEIPPQKVHNSERDRKKKKAPLFLNEDNISSVLVDADTSPYMIQAPIHIHRLTEISLSIELVPKHIDPPVWIQMWFLDFRFYSNPL